MNYYTAPAARRRQPGHGAFKAARASIDVYIYIYIYIWYVIVVYNILYTIYYILYIYSLSIYIYTLYTIGSTRVRESGESSDEGIED